VPALRTLLAYLAATTSDRGPKLPGMRPRVPAPGQQPDHDDRPEVSGAVASHPQRRSHPRPHHPRLTPPGVVAVSEWARVGIDTEPPQGSRLPLLRRAATHPRPQPRGAAPRPGRTVAPHPQRRPSTPPSDPSLFPAGVVALPAVWTRLAGQNQHPLRRDRMPRLRSNATLRNDAASTNRQLLHHPL